MTVWHVVLHHVNVPHLFNQFSTDGRLSCVWSSVISNSAVMKSLVHIFSFVCQYVLRIDF